MQPGRNCQHPQPAEHGEADGRKCDAVETEGNGICRKDRRQDQPHQCRRQRTIAGTVEADIGK